jgi:hypothetical protein
MNWRPGRSSGGNIRLAIVILDRALSTDVLCHAVVMDERTER